MTQLELIGLGVIILLFSLCVMLAPGDTWVGAIAFTALVWGVALLNSAIQGFIRSLK